MVKNVIPELPQGVKITDKPSDVEFLQRCRSKWVPIIETLKIIDSTKSIEWDTTNINKKQINGIKVGIRQTAKKMNFKPKIKFCEKGNTLYIWSNR